MWCLSLPRNFWKHHLDTNDFWLIRFRHYLSHPIGNWHINGINIPPNLNKKVFYWQGSIFRKQYLQHCLYHVNESTIFFLYALIKFILLFMKWRKKQCNILYVEVHQSCVLNLFQLKVVCSINIKLHSNYCWNLMDNSLKCNVQL